MATPGRRVPTAPRERDDESAAPLSAGEAFALIEAALDLARRAGSRPSPTAILAVSGGPDSLALLAFAGESRARFAAAGVVFRVATVDHGLRPDSGAEAEAVAAHAAGYGLAHRTLRWTGWDRRGNLPAAAREARYALLEAFAREEGGAAVLVAHHQDDQIETHLMAAERGGGLAGMRACRDLAPGLFLLRPFLAVPKARLLASLAARGLEGADDPTNRDERFLRARLRREIAEGAVERAEILGRIAAAGAVREHEDAALADALRRLIEDLAEAADEAGRVAWSLEAFHALPSALAGALLSRAVTAAGGALHPPRRADIRRLEEAMRRGDDGFAATLAGCRIRIRNRACVFSREYGRSGPEPVSVGDGATGTVFDRRFEVRRPPAGREGRGLAVVPFGRLSRGGGDLRTLPVLLDGQGGPLAAHPAVADRLEVPPLPCAGRVGWRLLADLRDENGRMLAPYGAETPGGARGPPPAAGSGPLTPRLQNAANAV